VIASTMSTSPGIKRQCYGKQAFCQNPYNTDEIMINRSFNCPWQARKQLPKCVTKTPWRVIRCSSMVLNLRREQRGDATCAKHEDGNLNCLTGTAASEIQKCLQLTGSVAPTPHVVFIPISEQIHYNMLTNFHGTFANVCSNVHHFLGHINSQCI
jgi:hypothetical protein